MLQVKFLMSILKWQVYSSPDFASLFSVTKDTRLYFSTSNNIYLPQRGPLKWRFETFECLGQSLTNSSREFWNGKSFPLQILRHFSVSWKITLLYFSSSNNIYFAQKEPIKVNIFETFECSNQNLSNSSCEFSNDKSIPLQILHHSAISWHRTPL